MKRAQNSGTTVMATTYEANSESTTASASDENKYLLTPSSRVTGKNTTTVVSVAASTGSATSRPPLIAACTGCSPVSRWRKMFSSTTTELSISRESASASPPSTMVFTELPPICSAMRVASTESGIEKNTATVARMLPRKTRIMIDVRSSPSAPSCSRVWIALFTNSD